MADSWGDKPGFGRRIQGMFLEKVNFEFPYGRSAQYGCHMWVIKLKWVKIK